MLWPDSYDIKYSDRRIEKIVAFGDSLTFGQGAKEGAGYPAHLEELSHLEVINLGRNGDTVLDSLSRLNDVIAKKPDMVIITLGGNDIIQQRPQEETIEALGKLFTKLHGHEILIAYVAIDPPFVRKERLNKIKELCREHGVLFIPNALSNLWLDSQMMSDQIHPNAHGYKIMAESVFEKIKVFLKR
ncbi:MAG: GDSL-type esterase/lipase family protein [Bdellovibrionota bacterium]